MKANHPTETRADKAARIASRPAEYKVCEGCASILLARTVLCPNCHSFRFDGNPQRVVRQARILGSRAQRSVTSEDLS